MVIFAVAGCVLLPALGLALYQIGREAGRRATREDSETENRLDGDEDAE